MAGHFRGVGEGTLPREGDRLFQFSFGLGLDFFELGACYLAAAFRREFLEANKRTTGLPFLNFLLGAIRPRAKERLLADDVTLPSVSLAFEQRRPFTGASASDHLARALGDFEDVLAVDDMAGDPIRLRAASDI